MGATSNGEVILEDSEDGKDQQLWRKGEPDAEGYFTLENSGVPKFITAISESDLEIKGNITLRCILLVDYLPCSFLHIDPTEGEPVGPHTMFRIGEVSKAITSATIMTMFERGEFT